MKSIQQYILAGKDLTEKTSNRSSSQSMHLAGPNHNNFPPLKCAYLLDSVYTFLKAQRIRWAQHGEKAWIRSRWR